MKAALGILALAAGLACSACQSGAQPAASAPASATASASAGATAEKNNAPLGESGAVLRLDASVASVNIGVGQVGVWTTLPGSSGQVRVSSSDESIVLAHSADSSSLPGIGGLREGQATVELWDGASQGSRLLATVTVNVVKEAVNAEPLPTATASPSTGAGSAHPPAGNKPHR